MILLSSLPSNNRIELGVRAKTLKDVRDRKHVLLLFKAIDKPVLHICLFTFTERYVSSQASSTKVEQYKKELEKLRSENSDEGYAIANNKFLKYSCYLGQLKPKGIPLDYQSRRMDENILMNVIQKGASRFTKRRHGMIFSMIRAGILGNGYEKMIPEDYIKMLNDHNISCSLSRSTLYNYRKDDNDYLSYSFDIKKFDENILSLKDTDRNKKNKLLKDVRFCCDLVDHYWQIITK